MRVILCRGICTKNTGTKSLGTGSIGMHSACTRSTGIRSIGTGSNEGFALLDALFATVIIVAALGSMVYLELTLKQNVNKYQEAIHRAIQTQSNYADNKESIYEQ